MTGCNRPPNRLALGAQVAFLSMVGSHRTQPLPTQSETSSFASSRTERCLVRRVLSASETLTHLPYDNLRLVANPNPNVVLPQSLAHQVGVEPTLNGPQPFALSIRLLVYSARTPMCLARLVVNGVRVELTMFLCVAFTARCPRHQAHPSIMLLLRSSFLWLTVTVA